MPAPKKTSSRQPTAPTASGAVRLQKTLASAGFGSRRACEEIINDGRVEVDRKPAKLGMSVDPAKQEIRVDGEALIREKLVYFLVHKPTGYVTTHRDPDGRPRVIDLIDDHRRLFPVGRLDMNSEGLILVTNDGDLANRLAHPRYEIKKTYQVQVAGHVTPQDVAAVRKGVFLADGRTNVERIVIKRRHKNSSIVEMVLTEGRNREIRRIFAGIGHKVQRLRRVAFGPLKLGEIVSGHYRMLTPTEVSKLRKVCAAAQPSERRDETPRGTRKKKKPTSRKPIGRKSTNQRAATKGKSVGRKKTTAHKTTGKSTYGKKATTRKTAEKPIGRKKATTRKTTTAKGRGRTTTAKGRRR